MHPPQTHTLLTNAQIHALVHMSEVHTHTHITIQAQNEHTQNFGTIALKLAFAHTRTY